MGTFVAVRGWLECDEQQLAAIQAIIEAHDDGYYSGGWATPRQHVNWTHYVFYGADMRESALEQFREQIQEIAQVPASDADGTRVTGLFFASHEIHGITEWHVHGGQVFSASGDERYGYLDA